MSAPQQRLQPAIRAIAAAATPFPLPLLAICLLFASGAEVRASEEPKVIHSIDFAGKQDKKALDWFKENGYRLEKDASNENRLAFSFKAEALVIEAKCKAFGLAVKEVPDVQARKVRITWGVDKFPAGASWDKGLNREALMLYLFFGKEKIKSGNLLFPSSPYYTGLFLSDVDTKDKVYIGNSYKTCGRYVCLANPKPGETVTTEFELEAFKTMFGKDKTPAVTGFSLEVDTGGTADGLSKAFVSRIEFLE